MHQQNLRRKQTEDHGQVQVNASLEQFEQALINTSKSFQYQSYQDFLEILNQWNILKNVLNSLMDIDAPSFSSIDSQLESIHSSLKKLYKTDSLGLQEIVSNQSTPILAIAMPTETIQTALDQVVTTKPQNFHPQAQNHLANREQAMQVLQEIADYFKINEPHSPVSYMLQKTIQWNQLPLHEWLAQVIKDENPLEMLHELLGVQTNINDTNNNR